MRELRESHIISAQFHDEDYSPGGKSLGLSGACYTYDGDDGMEPAIGEFLRVRFPSDWPQDERYEFNWQQLSALEDPFDNFDYARYAQPLAPPDVRQLASPSVACR